MGSDAGSDRVSEQTAAAEEQESAVEPTAGRAPTEEEAEAAERAGSADPGVAEAYRDMTSKGAEAEGEGRIP